MKGKLQKIARSRGEPLETLLPRLLNEMGSTQAVADHLGVHYNSVYRWCRKHNIRRQTQYAPVEAA